MTRPNQLTDKQERFAQEYQKDCNATQAAIRAGYSAKSADKIGSELLRKTRVAERVAELQQRQARKVNITVETVLEGLLSEATDNSMQASHSARVSAWAHLGRHLGMFTDKTELTGKDGAPLNALTIDDAVKLLKEQRPQQ